MSDNVPSASAAAHTWSTTPRRDPPKRHATERIADFLEIYGTLDETSARAQAARCVQCPDPMCVAGCPLQLNIPEWLALVADGHFFEAAATLHGGGSLPEICLRLCPADRLCESMCVIAGRAEPVAIWAVEHFLNRCAVAHGLVAAMVAPSNGRRVAVLGGGPGGLACASELVKCGYGVTVFDAGQPEEKLVESTPAFRLDRAIARRRVAILRQQGVEFRLRPDGANDTLPQFEASFAAVYLAQAARKPRSLDIPGIHLAGVAPARTFITQRNGPPPASDSPFDLRGKRVVVIGGGDTALDCLRTALRCGARQTIGVYRRDEESLPCTRREYENAIEEGVVYAFASTPLGVLGNAHREVCAVRFARTALGEPEVDGRRSVLLRPGTEYEIETEFVFLALGDEPDLLAEASLLQPLDRNRTGLLIVDDQQMTSRPGVFAGGDLVRGPCLALSAVRDARRAAAAIDRYVSALDVGSGRTRDRSI